MAKPAAVFPAAVAGDNNLMIASNLLQTQLVSPMGTADSVMNVQNAARIVPNSLLSIDAEIVCTTGSPSGNAVPVQRGFDGTTPAIHLASAKVSGYIDAWHHNAAIAEIQAIEQTLGANLSNLPSTSPPVANTAFNFPAQSPGGSLTVGTNSITLSPVPAGVNGIDTNHYLYISGGTGAPEAVLITGGNAVAGSPSGTLFINCANAHSGAWTIQSATAGIQEGIQSASPSAAWVKVPPGSYNVYGSITLSTGATLEGPGALYDSNSAPATLNWIPLTGSLLVVSADHVTIRGLTLYGGTSGTATTSIGIDCSGVSPRAAITFQLYDLYVRQFNIGYQIAKLTNSRGQALAAYNNVSHGFVLAGVQGEWSDLFAQQNGGDGLHLVAASDGFNASPFLLGIHTHNNGGWGIYATIQVNLTKFYINFDKAGELLCNTAVGALPGTVNDGHVEAAGLSPTYGTNPSAPGIRVAAASTSGLAINAVQVNTNQGNGVEFLGYPSSISNSTLAGNGQGGQAGTTNEILVTAAGQRIDGNNFNGTLNISGGTQIITNNSISANSPNPLLYIVTGTSQTVEANFINQAGTGPALRADNGTAFYGPFTNNIFGGSIVMNGSVTSRIQYVAANFISDTGVNNAIAGSLPGVNITTGLAVVVLLNHSLQAGPNTLSLNGGSPIAIKKASAATSATDLSVAFQPGGVIMLIYQSGFWLCVSQ